MIKVKYSNLLLALPILLGSSTAYAAPPTLVATPSAVTINYTLPSTAGTPGASTITAPLGVAYFSVNAATVPAWLSVTQNGTAGTGLTGSAGAPVAFSANAVAGNMLPGSYTAVVSFVSTATGTPAAAVTVTLAIKSTSTSFSAIASNSGTVSWSLGGPAPVVTILCSSNGEPISFAVAVSGSLAASMGVSPANGIAYAWGTTVSVSFLPSIYQNAAVGTTLTGTVTLTPNNGAGAVVIPISLVVAPSAATYTSSSPNEIAVDTADSKIVLNGSNFASGVTVVKVKIGSGAFSPALDAAHVVVTNSNSILLTLNAAQYLLTTQTLTIQVQNGSVGSPVTKTVFVTTKPIIYTIINAASFQQTTATGTLPAVAPYELISIFGANFAAKGELVAASPSALPMIQYPSTVTDSIGPVIVDFYSTNAGNTSATLIGSAPIIFVSSNQINAIVPQGVLAFIGANSATLGVHVIVSVNAVLSNTNNTFFQMDVAATNLGIFTPSGTGRGASAVLNANGSLNTATNPATKGTVVSIYATGLGDFGSYATNADAAIGAVSITMPGSCITPTAYSGILSGATTLPDQAYGIVQGSTPVSAVTPPVSPALDGLVLQSLYFWSNVIPPCMQAGTTTGLYQVNINGANVTPTYVGAVADSIVGLYQINVTLPATWSPAVVGGVVPVTIVMNGASVSTPLSVSQAGATIYVN